MVIHILFKTHMGIFHSAGQHTDWKHYLSLVVRKPVFGVSDQVRQKPGCTTTEDG